MPFMEINTGYFSMRFTLISARSWGGSDTFVVVQNKATLILK